jgi:hypothetical protein
VICSRALPWIAVLAAMLSIVAVAEAVEEPAQGVAYVSEQTFSIAEPRAAPRLDVELFNGSPREQMLLLEARGMARERLTVKPAQAKVSAGGVEKFSVTATGPADDRAEGVLIATSSDGTLARRAISIGSDPVIEGDTKTGYPKTLDFGIADTGDTDSIAVPGLPGGEPQSVQVGFVSGSGRTLPVTRKGDTLTISPLPESGTYSGTIDLTPGSDAGEVELTAKARDAVFWKPIRWLMLGLALALVLELFVRRLRPRWVLARLLSGIKALVVHRQEDAKRDVSRLRPRAESSEEGREWAVPIVYDPNDDGSLVEGRAREILESLKAAPSDALRDRWGPDGDEFKALETELASYRALLETLRRIATEWAQLHADARPADRPVLTTSPLLLDGIDLLLTEHVLGQGAIAHEQKTADAITQSVDDLVRLYRRLTRIEREAERKNWPDLAQEAASQRRDLVSSFSSSGDTAAWDAIAQALSKKVQGPQAPAVEVTRVASPAPEPPLPPHDTPWSDIPRSSAPTPVTKRKWFAGRYLSLADAGFALLSGALVVISGLSLLYFTDDTFGTTGDYVALFVWASTISAGITVARRVLPGAVKTIAG